MLLDHARGKLRPRGIYHCTRMTLGQYLDALAKSGGRGGGELFRTWAGGLLKNYGGGSPLGDALAAILRRYTAAWQEFDHVDHVLRCAGALACCLEQEGTGDAEAARHFREALCRYGPGLEGWELVEADKRYPDPCGYYFTLAYEYPEDAPDPGGGTAPGTVRGQIFLPRRDCRPETLRALAAEAPSPDFRALLEKYASGDRLAAAMREINTAVTDLYLLWVEPYLGMGA